MRRAISTAVGTVVLLVLLLSFKTSPRPRPALPAAIAPSAVTDPTDVPSAEPGRPRSQASIPAPAPLTPAPSTALPTPNTPPRSAAAPAERTVTGAVADTRYGPVQVQIRVVGTAVREITAVQLPSDRRRSAEISTEAEPLLRQEALTAQSAQIDVVSGATYTSEGYAQSLQSALDQLHAG
jgi:uncharacterized protein with FMN-binding domain